tara:strand:- start:653 stop:862 length:210 start_codon:yes stop_codon:yes gene_type:complete
MDSFMCNVYNILDEEDQEVFDLKMYIKSFVFSNWKYINNKIKTEDIIIDIELEEDEYFNDEEIFCKGII